MVRTWLSTLARLAAHLSRSPSRKNARRATHRPRFETLESRTLFDVGLTASILGTPPLGTEGVPIALTSSVSGGTSPNGLAYAWTVTKDGAPLTLPPASLTSGPGFTFMPPDNGAYAVTLTATDSASPTPHTAVDTRTLTALNVPPTVVIGHLPAGATAPAGARIDLSAAVTDPGVNDNVTVAWQVLNAATGQAVTPVATPVYPGGVSFVAPTAGTYLINATATDKDGASGIAAARLTVTPSGQSVAITNAPANPIEGTAITLGSTATGAVAYAWGVTWDALPFALPTGTVTNGPTFTFTPTQADPQRPSPYVVTLTVTTANGTVSTNQTLQVVSAKPAVTLAFAPGQPLPVPEGTPVTLAANVTDPTGRPGLLQYAWTVTTTDPHFTLPRTSVTTAPTFTFTPTAFGSGGTAYSWGVTLAVTDADGVTGTASVAVPVADLTPAVTVAPPSQNPAVNTDPNTLTLNALVANPGAEDAFTYLWSVQNATVDPASGVNGQGIVLHPTGAGPVVTAVTVTDSSGATGSSTAQIFATALKNDRITVSGSGATAVIRDAAATVPIRPGVTQLVILALGVNDVVNASASPLPAVLYAGDPLSGKKQSGGDTLIAGNHGDLLIGGAGADSLVGGTGNDTFYGGLGNDTMAGGAGDDVYMLIPAGRATVRDTSGANQLNFALAGSGITLDLNLNQGQKQTVDAAGDAVAITGIFPSLVGSAFGDTLTASSGSSVFGGGGDDTLLTAGGSNIVLRAGGGSDTLLAQGGSRVTLYAGAGNDTLMAMDAGDSELVGGGGNSTLAALGGQAVTLYGGAGNDTLLSLGGTGNALHGGAGDSTLTDMGGQEDTLYGGAGNDTLLAQAGEDITLYGGSGNDTLTALGSTGVSLYGGSGNDTLTANNDSGATLYGGTGNDSVVAFAGEDITLYGGSGNDSLAATDVAETVLYGGEGNSVLRAEGGQDITLYGGDGNDTLTAVNGTGVSLYGGTGNDSITAQGSSDITLYGGSGNDVIRVEDDQGVTLYAGSGNDTVTTQGGQNVSVLGGTGNDTISADGGQDITLYGGSGNDSITAQNGEDITLYGGSGNDTLNASGGSDITLYGGSGNDSFLVEDATGATLYGGSGNDTVTTQGGQNVSVLGGTGNDTITADGGQDITLYGGSGNDRITTVEGEDITLYGGSGNDTLRAEGGQDITLYGGSGNDVLQQGSGYASLTLGGLQFTAIPPGAAGNAISVSMVEVDDGMPGVQVNGNEIIISYGPGTTTAQVAAMLNANAAASALVTATGGNDMASPTNGFVPLTGG